MTIYIIQCNNCTIIWNNKDILFHSQPLYNKSWVKKGIVFLEDVVDNGGVSLLKVEEKIGKSNNTLLYFNVILNAIRRYLEGTVEEQHCCGQITIFGKCVSKLSSKSIRVHITSSKIANQEQTNLNAKVPDWKTLLETTSNTKLYIMQWKINNIIFPCGVYLKKIKINPSENCIHCSECKLDTIEHYFIQCPSLGIFWRGINNTNASISGTDILFGHPNKDINIIILIAKYAIYLCKLQMRKAYVVEYERQLTYFNVN